MKHFLFLVIAPCIFFSAQAQKTMDTSESLVITVLERRGVLPQFLAERDGALYSFAHKGDSLLENRTLGFRINIPQGFRSIDFEGLVREQLLETRFSIRSFLDIQIVYFDYNSALIRNDASAQLDKLALLMLTYPFARVDAVVHTDSRGSNEFNHKLATKRGDSIREYLKEAGVDIVKLSIKVSGEEELVNDCLDKVNCDEMLHQLNRRAEFIFNPLDK